MRRLVRYWYLRLRRRSTPPRLARGLAAGVFAGMFPIFGFQTIVAVLLATLIRGDQLVAALGTWVSNPLTYVPIYTFNFYLGQWLLRTKINFSYQSDIWQLGKTVLIVLFFGSFVMASVSSVFSYYLGIWLFTKIRRQRLHKSP
ncbi:MAG: DUF2062 domain-containing protein [Pseudanabaenaceae cyanobacterium SKYGB_i_bin29]|nr:DUF2062 domain-containing protein [Pseudanabaenaceae cyanobacterium SKYG29]MDW8422475.1 DUF2062 domain-containing protein [Pseudanabaenaceae cyanobacterium SKYGB_i_bin29]